MVLHRFMLFAIFVLSILPRHIQGHAVIELPHQSSEPTSPFSKALEILQKQIGYSFQSMGLLRRAMTHSSFSEENNRALSLLGVSLIETSVALRSLENDIDISAKDLSLRILDITKVATSCAKDGTRLGLQRVVRVNSITNSSTPSVVCGAFRAIFGAIAIDSGKSDKAESIFWDVHGGKVGEEVVLS